MAMTAVLGRAAIFGSGFWAIKLTYVTFVDFPYITVIMDFPINTMAYILKIHLRSFFARASI